jgi:hypothetical protein
MSKGRIADKSACCPSVWPLDGSCPRPKREPLIGLTNFKFAGGRTGYTLTPMSSSWKARSWTGVWFGEGEDRVCRREFLQVCRYSVGARHLRAREDRLSLQMDFRDRRGIARLRQRSIWPWWSMLRHRQTKEAATDMFSLQPPRHIPTLPVAAAKPCQRRRQLSPKAGIAAPACGLTEQSAVLAQGRRPAWAPRASVRAPGGIVDS